MKLSFLRVLYNAYVGTDDWLSTIEDAQNLAQIRKNLKIQKIEEFDHLEFIRGKNTSTILFPEILKNLQTTSSSNRSSGSKFPLAGENLQNFTFQ